MDFFAEYPSRGSHGRGREVRLKTRSDVTIGLVASLETNSPVPPAAIEVRVGLRPCSTGLPFFAAQSESRWGASTIESLEKAQHG